MAQRVLAFDWSRTSLGPLQDWPPMLLPTLQIGLETALPMCMLWGDDYLQIYNDAFAALAADRHPAALGARVQDSWPELWEFLQQVLPPARQGKPQALRGQRFRLRRHGAFECAWFDFSFTPIRLPDGTVGGVLAGVVEVTAQYRAEQARRDASIALHDSEAQLGAIFSQMAVGIAQADAGANFRMVNDALCAMLG